MSSFSFFGLFFLLEKCEWSAVFKNGTWFDICISFNDILTSLSVLLTPQGFPICVDFGVQTCNMMMKS